LPATIGGDTLRTYAVTRDGYSMADVISSIIVERLLGFIALFFFVLFSITLSIAVFGESFFQGIETLFWLFGGLFVCSVAAVYLSLNRPALHWLRGRLARWPVDWISNKFTGKINEVYSSYVTYQGKSGTIIVFILLSLCENLFPLFWTYFLALAFRIEVPLLYFFILVPIVLVLVRLPISLDGLGIQEGAFVYFLALIGIAHSEAFLLGVASHILGILSVLPGGVFYGVGGLGLNSSIYTRSSQL
jgi:uncharacterized protein (TIRG00374 family)